MKKVLIPLLAVSLMLGGCSGGNNQQSSTQAGDTSGSSVISSTSQEVLTPKKAFLAAKDRTFESNKYEYTYSIDARIKFSKAPSFSPVTISGNIQYDGSASNTQYVHKKDVGGLLVFDYTTYTYNVGKNLITINSNESKNFSVTGRKELPNNYQFETNSVGVVLKTLADNDNLSITKSGEKYNLSLKTSFAQDSVLHYLNYVDSTKIIDVLNKYISKKYNISFGIDCYATLDSQTTTVKTFHFGAEVNIKDVCEIKLGFDQTFTKVNAPISLDIPEFENTDTSVAGINTKLGVLKNAINNAKTSYYKYKVHTKVDHGVSLKNPLGLGVDSTSKGTAQRQIIGNDVYFYNELEFDSDYKNSDQYKDQGVVDYECVRTKLNNSSKDIYDAINHTWPKADEFFKVNNSISAVDDYYMMLPTNWLNTNNIMIMRKTTDKDSNDLYRLGASSEAIKSLLETYNDAIRIDRADSLGLNVYNIFSDFVAKKSNFEIELDKNGKLAKINAEIKGFYKISQEDQVKFEFDLEIEPDYSKKTFTAPTSTGEIF